MNTNATRNRPIVGKPDPFINESLRDFAAGKIDRDELSYRLRNGHARCKKNVHKSRAKGRSPSL